MRGASGGPPKARRLSAAGARSSVLSGLHGRRPQMLRTRVRAGAVTGFVMSLVFAVVLTLVERSDTFIAELRPEFGKPTTTTLRVPYAPLIIKSSRTGIAYGHARIVIPRGTVLDENNDAHRVAIAFDAVRRPTTSGGTL